MAAYTVPTIFTAVDKMSAVVKRMEASVGGFASKASIGVNAVNKGLNSLLPSVGGLAKQFLNLAGTAALFGGVAFSFKSLMDYEKAIQSFRNQLSDLNNNAFKPYQEQINSVAIATRRSAIDVAGSFNAIALRNHDLAATADGMAKISNAGILLSKAAGMEIIPATEGLVNVLTLFKLGARGSERAVNVLAAGMKYGSATVDEMVESLKTVGPVAVGANVSLEQSTALLGTLAKFQIKAEYAGTTLRTGIIRLQKAGLGYRNGLFDINDALDQATHIYDRMTTAKKKDAFLNQLFGIRGIIAGRVLLTNIPLFRQITKEITGTAEAHRMAAINTDTLINRLTELKSQWVNYLVTNKNAGAGFQKLKGFIVSVTDHLDTIVNVIGTVVKWFLILKAVIWTTQLILAGYNIVMGITGAVTGVANIAIGESVVAMTAYKIATGLATAINWIFGTSIGAATTATIAETEALTGLTSEFALADGAAAGLLGTIGSLGLIDIAGILAPLAYFPWKMFTEHAADVDAMAAYNADIAAHPYQKTYVPISDSTKKLFKHHLKMTPAMKDYGIGNNQGKYELNPMFKNDKTFNYNSINDNPAKLDNDMHLHVYSHNIDIKPEDIKTPAHIPVTLHQTSTTDNR